MREILFKAKRKDNGEWVKGYLYINGRDEQCEILCYKKDTNIEKITEQQTDSGMVSLLQHQ